MPKQNKGTKDKRQKAVAAVAQSDDDFDDMVAEVCAADLASPLVAGSTTNTNASSSSSSSSSSSNPIPAARATRRRVEAIETVSEEMIVQACTAGDVSLLRRWARRGIVVISTEPLFCAAATGKLDAVRVLVRELGADVNQACDGVTALHTAAYWGHEHVVRCLVKRFDADVNKPTVMGILAVYGAAQMGHEHVVRCLVKEFGADVNKATIEGCTPLMAAAEEKHTKIVVWLTKHGADSQASHPRLGTAADLSKANDVPAEQTAYLEARTHCAKPGCSGAGLKKYARCLVIFYCCKEYQVAHWPAHKVECKRSAGLSVGNTK
jgi:hypothetical protein